MVIDSQVKQQRTGAVLAVLCGAPFLAGLDLFVVNVAFNRIGTSFPGHSLADLSWILNGYAIVYAALLIPLGRWADLVGNKRGFVLGLSLFTVASLAAAAAPNLPVLIACRLLQALGAAALTPTSLGLLLHAVPGERRAMSVRIWAASSAIASALGPVIGGLLVELSWRWIFLINVPIGAVLVWLALRQVPDYRADHAERELDLVGVGLLTVGIGSLALSLVQGNSWGWRTPGTVAGFVIAVVALVGFAWNNARHRSPLIDPALLRVRSFAWANAAALLFSASFAAGLLASILWMQDVWGYSALKTGFAVSPGPLMVPLFALGGQALTRRVSPGTLIAIGSALWAAGTLLVLTLAGPKPHYAAELLPGWIICGIGVGLALPTILASATAALPPARSATGSAVVSMTRQVGMVIGISALVAVLGSPVGYRDFYRVWWVVAAVALAAAVTALNLSPRRAAAR
jgi:EmrB/QacA subfamily drug resistance transporter